MKTKLEIIEAVAAKVAGTVRRNYSGRGMYGKTCVGIVCESPVTAVKSAQSRGLSGALTDNMGRDYIVYWPTVQAIEINDGNATDDDCKECGGHGHVDCPSCEGTGEHDMDEPCETCDGCGEVDCAECEGQGVER